MTNSQETIEGQKGQDDDRGVLVDTLREEEQFADHAAEHPRTGVDGEDEEGDTAEKHQIRDGQV